MWPNEVKKGDSGGEHHHSKNNKKTQALDYTTVEFYMVHNHVLSCRWLFPAVLHMSTNSCSLLFRQEQPSGCADAVKMLVQVAEQAWTLKGGNIHS